MQNFLFSTMKQNSENVQKWSYVFLALGLDL